MEEIVNKRKIKKSRTLEGRRVHKKTKQEVIEKVKKDEPIGAFVQVKKDEKDIIRKVSPFQLVVIKVPWYRKVMRSLMSLFGYYYE